MIFNCYIQIGKSNQTAHDFLGKNEKIKSFSKNKIASVLFDSRFIKIAASSNKFFYIKTDEKQNLVILAKNLV